MADFAGVDPQYEQARAWTQAHETFKRFDAADHYLFSVPMWNAGIPYILKQLIDVVSQPGMLFSFDPVVGYTGLLSGKKAAVVYTSAVYGPGRGPAFGNDFQQPYLEDWLRWAGVDDITSIEFRPNLATPRHQVGRSVGHHRALLLATSGQIYWPPAPFAKRNQSNRGSYTSRNGPCAAGSRISNPNVAT